MHSASYSQLHFGNTLTSRTPLPSLEHLERLFGDAFFWYALFGDTILREWHEWLIWVAGAKRSRVEYPCPWIVGQDKNNKIPLFSKIVEQCRPRLSSAVQLIVILLVEYKLESSSIFLKVPSLLPLIWYQVLRFMTAAHLPSDKGHQIQRSTSDQATAPV